jgi:hypothetical protein
VNCGWNWDVGEIVDGHDEHCQVKDCYATDGGFGTYYCKGSVTLCCQLLAVATCNTWNSTTNITEGSHSSVPSRQSPQLQRVTRGKFGSRCGVGRGDHPGPIGGTVAATSTIAADIPVGMKFHPIKWFRG